MKKITALPANEICIQFKDTEYIATFNMTAIGLMQENLAEMQSLKINEIPQEKLAALIMYSGIKVNHEQFTMDEANALALTMRPADIEMIISEYTDSVGIESDSTGEEFSKKIIAQILTNMAKS